MALIEYTTVPAVSNEGMFEFPSWFEGSPEHSGGLTGDLGYPAYATQSDSYFLTGTKKPINEQNALTFAGNNGKDHWETVVMEARVSLFVPAGMIQAFSFVSQQNSIKEHSLFLKRMGLKFRTPDKQEKLWISGDLSRLQTLGEWTNKVSLSDSDRAALQGYYLNGYMLEVSSESKGSGTRNTTVQVGNFKLYYDLGPENTRWVVGAMRAPAHIEGGGGINFN